MSDLKERERELAVMASDHDQHMTHLLQQFAMSPESFQDLIRLTPEQLREAPDCVLLSILHLAGACNNTLCIMAQERHIENLKEDADGN